jgi:hypothetical protein
MNQEVTDKQAEWLKALEEAKSYLKNRKICQMKVAKLAASVCEITKGGGNREGRYTIKAFSKGTGLSYKSLCNWIFVYRGIYCRLPKALQEKANYTKLANVSYRVNSSTSQNDIIKYVNEEISRNAIESQLMNYAGDVRAMLYNLKRPDIWNTKMEILEEAHYWIAMCKNQISKLSRVKKIAAVNHGKICGRHGSFSVNKAFELDAQFAESEVGKVKINDLDKKVYAHMRANRKIVYTPSRLGEIFYEGSKMSKKLKALRSLEKLVTLDLVDKVKKGHYQWRQAA